MSKERIVSDKLCACGCGEFALLAVSSRKLNPPNKFIHGHHGKGKHNSRWNGGMRKRGGYWYVWKPEHPRAGKRGYVPRSYLIIEKVLNGKYFPKKAVVHHFNEDRGDDSKGNIVACENSAYHMFLHKRQRAFYACGNANWLKCSYCQKYDDPKNMHVSKNDRGSHTKCASANRAKYFAKNKEKVDEYMRKYRAKRKAEKERLCNNN